MSNKRIRKKKEKQLAVKQMVLAEQVSEAENGLRKERDLMKTQLFVQYQGSEVSEQDIVNEIKQWWKDQDKLVKDLKTLDMYVKPEDKKVYFTVNGDLQGSLDIL